MCFILSEQVEVLVDAQVVEKKKKGVRYFVQAPMHNNLSTPDPAWCSMVMQYVPARMLQFPPKVQKHAHEVSRRV